MTVWEMHTRKEEWTTRQLVQEKTNNENIMQQTQPIETTLGCHLLRLVRK